MIPIDRLIEADRKSPKLIIVIGDGMTDVYAHGHLEDCQEGCRKFVESSRVEVPGGAANAVRSLENWSVRTRLMSDWRLGPVKTRLMVDGRCSFRHDVERCDFDLDTVRREGLEVVETWRIGGVLLSDYDKGILTPRFIREVVDTCARRGVPCVADVKREPDMYRGAVTKGNAQWRDRYSSGGGVITDGSRAPCIDGRRIDIDLPTVECVNHVGAGDCFAAHLLLGLVHGLSLKEAVAVAHSAGRVYVQRRYNAPPRLDDIMEDMRGVGDVCDKYEGVIL